MRDGAGEREKQGMVVSVGEEVDWWE